MLLKVKYGSTKKYIRLQSGFTYADLICEVKNKFGLPDGTELHIFDDSDTAVEEDVLLELIESKPDLCLTVCDSISDKHSCPSTLPEEQSVTLSVTDFFRELGIPTVRDGTSCEVLSKSTTEISESVAAKEEDSISKTEREVCAWNHNTFSFTEGPLFYKGLYWDSDMASLVLLLHLLPPTAGRKRIKISPNDAVPKMVHFHKSYCSIGEHLQQREGKQPYILAIGRTQNKIETFYIVVDKQLIPCQATSSLGAFDELFKSHYVFNLSYEESLVQLYTFVQTTIFNIDVTTTDESPRVRELRAKLLN